MKTILLTLSLAVAGVSTAHAQLYSPTVARTTVLGGIVGALIGGHNNDHWGEGAALGAAAGALFGAAVDQPPSRGVVYAQPQIVTNAPCVTYAEPTPVVCVTSPPVRYVQVAPAPRVVYVSPRPYYAPRYVARPPVVVVAPRGPRHGSQTVVYSAPRGGYRN